jgi:hypothetical protein
VFSAIEKSTTSPFLLSLSPVYLSACDSAISAIVPIILRGLFFIVSVAGLPTQNSQAESGEIISGKTGKRNSGNRKAVLPLFL